MSLVTLLKAHTHAGVPHAIGEEIDVLAHDAAWLFAQGVATLIGRAPAPARTAEPGPDPEPDPDHPDTLE